MIRKRRPVATIIILVLQAMYEAVKDGDIDLLEDLLEKPNADINMVYVSANTIGGNLVKTESRVGGRVTSKIERRILFQMNS